MSEAQEKIRTEFISDLKALLRKWDTEIEIEDYDHSWSGHNSKMTVFIHAKHSDEGDLISPCVEIDLGRYMTGDIE